VGTSYKNGVFALDGAIGWDIAGSIVGTVTVLAIVIIISVILGCFDK